MVADSELEYLVVFVEEATTALVVDCYVDRRDVQTIASAKKCLIYPGETLSIDGSFYKKRYLVKLSLENENNMTSIVNEIIEGIKTYNKRGAGYTFPVTMCNLKFAYSGKSFIDGAGRWNLDIYLDVEWSTS